MAIQRKVAGDTLYLMDGTEEVLSITETVENSQVLIKLRGTLRSDAEHELLDEMVMLTTLGMNLTVDVSEVRYISAACQQVLLTIQQKMDELGRGSLLLTKLPPEIMKEFEKTGLSELLMIDE